MIIQYSELESFQGKKTVFTAGCFDLLHKGHVDFLQKIKKRFPSHQLVVGLLPDRRIRSKKGVGRPILKQTDRLAVIDSVRFVDYAFICPLYRNGQDSTFVILERLKPEFVVFSEKKYLKSKQHFEAANSKLVIQARAGSNSTTKIIKRIRGLEAKQPDSNM